MKVKVLILFVLFLSADFFFTSCCLCDKKRVYETNVHSVFVRGIDTYENIIMDTTIKRSNYRVSLELEIKNKKVSLSAKNHGGLLVSTAYACKCPEDEFIAVRSIKNIEIIPNTPVWTYDAGDTIRELDEIALFNSNKLNDPTFDKLSYEEFLTYLKSNYFKNNFFEFVVPLNTDEFIDFEYLITYSDNTRESFKPGRVKLVE